ncbi:putative chloride channel [Synechococcus sp. BIOS-E4-1]|uniref:chloride channel protein n=1 Tax=Synechococcus sp. BIOS-E4-1 TaxID=1400864 RepID=UPI0016495638|nr:chloride channel protein [Synechococcus sp. BIOS-E4-1]QNI54229.1 putative chloride channel [Synechococcus sp. BIOS-E4-1]
MTWLWLLVLGAVLGLFSLPYQALSSLGLVLQHDLWLSSYSISPVAVALVFVSSLALVVLGWGPLQGARGGGLTPVIALQENVSGQQASLLQQLSLQTQLKRLPLMVFTHLGGLTVGIESPSASLGASILLAIRRRWPQFAPLAALPLPMLCAIGGGAGLGAAFRSPLLGVTYAIEELGRSSGRSLVLPVLLLSGSGAGISIWLGPESSSQSAVIGALPLSLWPYALLVCGLCTLLGSLFVRLLVPLARIIQAALQRHRSVTAVLIATGLSGIAIASGGWSLNDGSLSLLPILHGEVGGESSTFPWRFLSSLLSIASGAPGGLMHDTMTLGALVGAPPTEWMMLDGASQAQLGAIGSVSLFAAACGTPLFCAMFVFTLQGDPAMLPALLLCSAIAASLAVPLRGASWNERQALHHAE